MSDCEQCRFLMRECLDCKLLRLEKERDNYKRGFEATKALLATQETLVELRTKQRDAALTQLEEAQLAAKRSYRCAQHLAVMHRRENRVMEGAEGELEAIRREAGGWLTEQNITDE